MKPSRLAVCLGVALCTLLASACSPGPGGDSTPDADATASSSPSARNGENNDDGASPSASVSPSASAGPASPSREEPTPAKASTGQMQTIDLDGLAFDLPEDWEELDRTNVTTVRGDGTAADIERVWRVTMPDAPNVAVATVTYMEDRGSMDESVAVEDRRARIRDWAGSTVESLAEKDPASLGASLELNGLGCRAGSVTMSGAPQLADVGEDGPGQGIRMDYTCQAFRDPSLGEVTGHRWVTTDVEGRRRDVHVTAYTGWLEKIGQPDLTRRIVESIRPE